MDGWDSLRGNKSGEIGESRGRGGEFMQPQRARYPNHIVANASTRFIAEMRALSTQASQEEENMICIKLHLHGGMHMIPGGRNC